MRIVALLAFVWISLFAQGESSQKKEEVSSKSQIQKSTKSETKAQTPEAVIISKPIQKGALQAQTPFLGTLHFLNSSKVASQTSGVVEKVYFKIGDSIKLNASLAKVNADLLQKEIQSKQAKLSQAQYIHERQQKELARYKNLLKSESVSLQQYESIEYEQKSQYSHILALTSELESAKMEFAKKHIKGEWINVGDPICEIVDTTSAEIIVDVPSHMLTHLKRGQEVGVLINKKHYKGKIYAIIPRADVHTRTFPVHISVENDGSFVDGMATQVLLSSGGVIEGNMVPRDCIVEYLGMQSVFVVRDSRAYAVPVEVLSVQGSNAIVRGNLKSTDSVVYRGQDRLQNGMQVKESTIELKSLKK